MRWLPMVFIALAGCGGKIAPGFDASHDGESAGDGSVAADSGAGDASVVDASDAAVLPVPACRGDRSSCVPDDAGNWSGATVVRCDGIELQGPLTFVLEHEVNGQFATEIAQVVDEPGFGTTFYDRTPVVADQTYRVCVVSKTDTKCGSAFTSEAPPDCVCEAWSCDQVGACGVRISDGCGHFIQCDTQCRSGIACNMDTHSCCPPGTMSDGFGGQCVCAPPVDKSCGRGQYWDVVHCQCLSNSPKPAF